MRLLESRPLQRYLVAVSAAGVGLLAAIFITGHLGSVLSSGWKFWLFAAFVILGELRPIDVPRRDAEIATSTTFTFAILLAYGLGPAILAQVAASLITDVVRRRPPLRSTFNVAQYTLSYAAAAGVLTLLSDVPHAGSQLPFAPQDLPAIIAAGAVFFLVNNALAGTASALAAEEKVFDQLRDDLGFQGSAAAVLLGLAPIVVVSSQFSPLLVPLLLLPLIAIHIGGWQVALNGHEALHDSLTGLPNRTLFNDRAEQAIRAASRESSSVGVMVLDLDRFKEVNDTLGHDQGDLLLQKIAAILQETPRQCDTVARFGGDEFAILAPDATPREAEAIAARMLAAFEQPITMNELELSIGASVGVACWPQHGGDLPTLLKRADRAMYMAKQTKSRYHIFATEDAAPVNRNRVNMVTALSRAVDRGEVALHYQPKVEVPSRRPWAVEALARWSHPAHGFIPPAEFIPLAENTGTIRPLTLHVLDAALRQWSMWREDGIEVRMAVNLSAKSLLDPRMPDDVAAQLQKWQVPPDALQLELTESTIMVEPAFAIEALNRIASMGVGLSVDDFGIGHSSLAYLKQLPVSEVKIDKSFVSRMTGDSSDAAIVESMIELGHKLQLSVVAEGVEDEDVWSALKDLGCDLAQGYYFSRPLSARDLAPALRELPQTNIAPRIPLSQLAVSMEAAARRMGAAEA
jgi:diguanylate cyclase (GGDEF)-like protein